MKKFLALLLIAMLAFSLVACGSDDDDNDRIDFKPNKNNKQTEAPVETETEDNIINIPDNTINFLPDNTVSVIPDVTVNVNATELNQVVYDKGGIKVTATELGYEEFWGPVVTFLVENNTTKDINVTTDDLAVNGIAVSSSLYSTVAAGKKVYEDMTIYETYLEEYKISEIGTLSFCFDIYEDETYDNIDTTDRIELVIDNNVKTELMTNGNPIYVDKNIKIYDLTPLKENDEYNTYVSTFLIVNDSKTNISVSCEDVSVNGFMVDPFCYARVPAGCAAYSDLYFSNDTLKDNKITAIDEVEFTLEGYDYITYDDVFETDTIKLTK